MSRVQDRPLRLRFHLVVMALGVASFVVARLLASWPAAAEGYARHVAPRVIGWLSALTGMIPFSTAEALVAATLGILLWNGARAAMQVVRKRRGLGNALALGALRLGSGVGWAAMGFYLLWGLHYSRAPLEQRLGWPPGGEVRPAAEELAKLAEEAVVLANEAYVELHGLEDLGIPTPGPADPDALEAAIDQGWERVRRVLPEARVPETRYGRSKRPWASRGLSHLSLGGFFFPWTGETNVNGHMPAVSVPHAVAHEKAHQRGFAPEDEANFMGFVAGSLSDDPRVRYSALLFAQRQLLDVLFGVDREAFDRISALRVSGVQRDIDDLFAYWRRFEGAAGRAAENVNELYLRSNRVAEGTRSYGLSLVLIVEYARRHGDSLAAAAPPGQEVGTDLESST